MAEQWIRAVNLTVTGAGGALDLSAMRIQFHTTAWQTQSPAKLVARITNLSAQTTQRFIDMEFKEVVLKAGYESDIGEIFRGTILQCRSGEELNFTDTYLDIIATNPDRSYNWAIVNKTLAAGSTPKDTYNACLQAMQPFGISQGFLPTDGRMTAFKYPRAVVLFGMARDVMRVLGHSLNCNWSIQKYKLQLVPVDGFIPGSTIVLNSRTGMIGLPVQTTDGIIVRALIDPNIKVGGLIQLDNASIQRMAHNTSIAGQPLNAEPFLPNVSADGVYVVEVIEYLGDTRGEPWYVDITCIRQHGPLSQGLIERGQGFSPYLGQG